MIGIIISYQPLILTGVATTSFSLQNWDDSQLSLAITVWEFNSDKEFSVAIAGAPKNTPRPEGVATGKHTQR